MLFCVIPGMVSLWSLAVIAFERWLVICKPLGNFIFKPDHALACCLFTWVFALIASVPPLVGWSRYATRTNLHTELISQLGIWFAHSLYLWLFLQIYPRRPAVLLWTRLVHHKQQIQQWILRDVPFRLLLCCSPYYDYNLLWSAAYYTKNGEAKNSLQKSLNIAWKLCYD